MLIFWREKKETIVFEVPLISSKLLTSHSNLTDYEVDIISSVVPVRELGMKEAGNCPKLYRNLSSDLQKLKLFYFFPSPQTIIRSNIFTPFC